LSEAVAIAADHLKVAVLVSPDSPPEALAKELVAAGVTDRRMVVCSRLGLPDESVIDLDIESIAAGSFDPLSVVIVLGDAPSAKTLAWGRPDQTYLHRAGMITHSEVRAVALSKLELPAAGVLWDVGAGSGSVAAECNALSPGLTVFAIERNGEDCERIAINAPAARLVQGDAPACLDDLPAPDRAFVGGGGLGVLDAVLQRLQPGARVVATYAAMDRALAAAERLGSLVQLSASRGARLPDGGLRLAAENPVFIVWGPTE
jgi:precorrin-6Y C5,15-methyltransferase (decarboxylating)